MGALNVGRISLEVEPAEWAIERGLDSQAYSFRGFLISDTQANTQYIRNELIGHHGDLVAVTWDTDPWFNGYYYLTDVRVETVPMSYLRRGLFPFEITFFRVGGYATTELQSLLSVGDRLNDFGTTAQPYHAPSIGALAYNAGAGDPTEVTRDTEDGNIVVYLDIDPDEDPSWSVDPASYYDGAVEIYTDGDTLRTGRELPGNDPTDWYMSNGLIQVRADTYQSTSNGRFGIRAWDGSAWDSWLSFKITWSGSNDVPEWHYMTIVKNTPEACIVKLVRDAATVPTSAHRHTLDFLLRRGAPFVECIYSYSAGTLYSHRVGTGSTTAATRPGGTASYIYGDSLIDGHRWVLGAPNDFTANANGYITMDDDAKTMPFFVGWAINNDSGDSGPVAMTQQYTGPVAETVRAVRR